MIKDGLQEVEEEMRLWLSQFSPEQLERLKVTLDELGDEAMERFKIERAKNFVFSKFEYTQEDEERFQDFRKRIKEALK